MESQAKFIQQELEQSVKQEPSVLHKPVDGAWIECQIATNTQELMILRGLNLLKREIRKIEIECLENKKI